ncbi:MAG: elongation factor Ts [Candidatus Dojkabacteria bacterium]|nr:MAG: elongation factor Ts [Candidatus Dojkabacteria bacterium]
MANNEILLRLRKETKASFGLCKEAADKYPDNYEEAKKYIVELIKQKAGKREGRVTQNGIIHAYVHGNGALASLVEILCETDFVARNEELKQFAHDVALQIVATNPQFVSSESIDAKVVEDLKAQWKEELLQEGKPEAAVEKIIDGKLKKYLAENTLIDQPFFKDESKTIRDMLEEVTGKLGENIKISRFERWQI